MPMLWEKEGCSGTVIRTGQKENKTVDIRFNIACGVDGSIDIQVEPLEFREEVLWLIDVFHAPDTESPQLLLKGQTAEGLYLSSDNLYLTEATPQIRQSGAKTIFPIKFECVELLASVSNSGRGVVKGTSGLIRYDVQGFRCFPSVSTMAEVGKISAVGAAKIENYDNITGAITIEVEQLSRVEDWTKKSDEQLEGILDIFSLAGGRYLEWARESLSLGGKWIETIFRSPAHRSEPNQPISHYLNMQPILDLAVSRYNKEVKEVTGFGVALEQFLISSLYVESQFSTSFMALEHLVNTYALQRERSTILTKDEFTNYVIPEIIDGLKRAKESIKVARETKGRNSGSIKKAFKAISGKIDELNRYSFVQNMWKFLDEIGVPLEDLSRHEIEQVVQTRHTIIHSGSLPTSANTRGKQQGLSLLRELLTRIFLTLLKYEGEYSSYLDGHQYRRFSATLK